MATSSSSLTFFNTLQFRKSFSTSLNYHSCFHFLAFPSSLSSNSSSFFTLNSSYHHNISAISSGSSFGISAETLDFRDENGNSTSGYLLNDRKSRKSGKRFNLGVTNEKGNDSSANHNSNAEVADFRINDRKRGENFRNKDDSSSNWQSLSYLNYEIGEENAGKGVIGDRKSRRNGVGNERVEFRNRVKSENNNSDSGWSSEYGKTGGNYFRKRSEMANGNSPSKSSREYGYEKDGKTGGTSDYGKRREIDDGVLPLKSGGGKWVRGMGEIQGSVASEKENIGQTRSRVSSQMPKNNNMGKRKERLSKKQKADSPEFQLKIKLDRCSKIGDVMGAISLYDMATKEGVKMSQHHYTGLLYLCSSAAMGVIRPAKSGSGTRMLNNADSHDLDGPNDFEDEEDDEEFNEIRVSDDVKKHALEKGFEVYARMCSDKVEMNEAALTSIARMAMSMGNGDMAFDMVKQMKLMGINPKLRSYSPALSAFSNTRELEKAFEVEKHMLENNVIPEEPELEALLRVSVECGKADKVYYVLHKLRTKVRSVSPSIAELIEKWFTSREASRVGKRKWDVNMLAQIVKNVGGGWHGQGWLGSGKWIVSRTSIGEDGSCKCCEEKLALIDLDPEETDKFADSVANIAIKRDRNSTFQKFQRWLDYYGPFEAVVDAANVGLYSQRNFKPAKVNAVVNGIRQLLPSKKWPLIILHNKRVTGDKMTEPVNKAIVEKWKNADALYPTPTGSNDDWYWLYAAIKFKCLLLTNDEMRDHTFQLLGNDFFPKWKERHQVRFSFSEIGPVFHMPPPCSVVIQESDRGIWHIPIASDHQSEGDRIWMCISRPKVLANLKDQIGADPGVNNPGD